MSVEFAKMQQVFLSAVERHRPEDWDAYLDQACAGDDELRDQVRLLLKAHLEAGSVPGAAARDPDQAKAHQNATESAGAVVGPYKLIEPIGEGGMGTVWMAQQTEPVKRLVAVKLIKAGMDSKQVVARFEAERQALALMDHPNIAKVLGGGTTDAGRPYFVMDLVKGVPITRYCDEHQLTPRQRLELFLPVCQAVQHAHQKGVIHRDLKPSNVLVAQYDGRPAPKVIDFGVAKAAGQQLTDKTLVTGFGAIVGTLEYMSPEQAEVNQLDIDTRSDIYSLGVLLYELLAGSPPFSRKELETAGMLEMLRVIREQEPSKPSMKLSTAEGLPTLAANRGTEPAKLTKLVRGELDWIVMKALEKDRNRRYETANGFAADVQRYLADEPVQACPPSTWYRVRKLARRNKRALFTVAVLALAAVVGVGALAVSTVLVWKANKDLTESLDRERESVARERLATDGERREAYLQRITVTHRELSTGNPAAALRALNDCPEDLRGWEWYYLMRLCKVDPLVIPAKTEVRGVAFSPTGDRLASAGGDGTVKIWNSTTGKMTQTFPAHSDSVLSVAFHPDGKHVASVGADKQVKVWDLTATDQAVFTERCDATRKVASSYTVAFSPNGRLLAAGSEGVVRVWDWENRQVLHPLSGHDKNAISVAFSCDGRLASASTGERVNLWDAQTGEPLRTFRANPHPVSALAFSPDSGRLAEASLNRKVRLWDTATGKLRYILPHDGGVGGVAFSADGRRLASAGEEKIVRIWDAATGREVLGLRGHAGAGRFSPGGEW